MPNIPQICGTRTYVYISFIGPYLLYTLSPLLASGLSNHDTSYSVRVTIPVLSLSNAHYIIILYVRVQCD